MSSRARTAARSTSSPAPIWTFIICTPSRAAAPTAAATVRGMSWNFRSRKTLPPRSRIMVTARGPTAVNSSDPTLNHLTAGARVVTNRAAPSKVGTSSATMRRSAAEAAADIAGICSRIPTPDPRPPDRISAHLQAPGHLSDIVHVVLLKITHQSRAYLSRNAGAVDDRRPYGNGPCSGDEKLEGVLSRGDPAHPDDWRVAVARDLPYHPHRDRSDRRPREPACPRAHLCPACVDVDGETDQRVDQRERICAGLLRRAGDRDDIGDVWRELDEQRVPAHRSNGGHQLAGQLRIDAKNEATVDVGAGDVEFDRRHPLLLTQPLREGDKLPD